MHTEFWLERWREQQIGFHQASVNAYLQHYWAMEAFSEPPAVFVPLCGKSLDLWWLRDQGCRVIGCELSELAVQDFFSSQNVEPIISRMPDFNYLAANQIGIYQGDFFKLRAEHVQGISQVYDRAALIALPPAMRAAYVKHLRLILPAEAVILLIALEYSQAEMAGPPFAVLAAEVEQLFGSDYAIDLLSNKEVLAQNPHFQQRGLTQLLEKVYRLRPKSPSKPCSSPAH